MLLNDPDDPIFQALDGFFSGLGLVLVELATRTKNGTTSVHLVVASTAGAGIDDLARAHRQLIPQLETLLGTEELSVELSTPGLERNLKFRRELGLYQGKKVRLYLAGAADWEAGVLASYDGEAVGFQTPQGTRSVPVGDIKKAKLQDL